MQPDIDSHN